MHNIIKTLLIFVFALLCSCSKSGMNTATKTISEETDSYSINCEIITADGKTEGINQFNELCNGEINQWVEDFKTRAERLTVAGSEKPCLQARNSIKLNNNKILSLVTEKYVYTNGLHGNTWWSAKNYDIKNDCLVRLPDLFIDDKYPEILAQRISELIENDSETYHDLWEEPTIDSNRNDKFYLDDKNLVIFYQPYELSYYARGVVEFPIPLEKIRGYIKPEYLPG